MVIIIVVGIGIRQVLLGGLLRDAKKKMKEKKNYRHFIESTSCEKTEAMRVVCLPVMNGRIADDDNRIARYTHNRHIEMP